MTYTYKLPDGSTDAPDANGMHMATVNVMHSAKQLERFPGCEQCASCAESDRMGQDITGHYTGWDGEDFTGSHYTVRGSDHRYASYGDAADAWRAEHTS